MTLVRHLRNNPTPAELTLWHALARVRPRFTRQLKIGTFTVDLACRRARLIVEVDGSQHVDNAHDVARIEWLNSVGWQVVRFWNGDVLHNVEGVMEMICAALAPRLPPSEEVVFIASRAGRERQPRGRREKKDHP